MRSNSGDQDRIQCQPQMFSLDPNTINIRFKFENTTRLSSRFIEQRSEVIRGQTAQLAQCVGSQIFMDIS